MLVYTWLSVHMLHDKGTGHGSIANLHEPQWAVLHHAFARAILPLSVWKLTRPTESVANSTVRHAL